MLPARGWGITQPPLPQRSRPLCSALLVPSWGVAGFFLGGGATSTPPAPWGWEGDVSIPWAAPDAPRWVVGTATRCTAPS